jgi:hypothetical protein
VAIVVLGLLGIVAAGAVSASAEVPPFEGLMSFPTIHGPEDPEEFSWKVTVFEDQELVLIDDQHAVVYYKDSGDPPLAAFHVFAEPARDATGSAVPTSIALSGGDVVTLTVHHRGGNPVKAGAPFIYPITPGSSFKVGDSSATLLIPPSAPAPSQCIVPMLVGKSLKVVRLKLANAGCKLGKVRGKRSNTAKVVRQHREPGIVLRDGAHVAVKLEG